MRNKKFSLKKRILITFLVLVLVVCSAAGAAYLYFNSKVSMIKHVDLPTNKKDLNISISDAVDKDYVNILLLGIDSRDEQTDPGRSDCTMILTLDKKHKSVKVTSILRDSIMTMKGHGPMEGFNQDRLNHAYAYGGPLLSIKTVNENFKMNIQDYIRLDFAGVEKIIDAVGGVPINISAAEVPYANDYIREVAGLEKKKPNLITHAGLQNLTGIQALGYSRIRYVGNGDFERTERQRIVLDEVFKKLSTKSITQIPGLANQILPYMETSLNKNQIFDMATFIVTNKVKTFEQNRLPIDGSYQINYSVNNTYFIIWDTKKNIDELHKFIFQEDASKVQ